LCGKRECWRGCKTKSVFKVYGACTNHKLQRPVAFEKLRRWTYASEAARNIGPDTPEKKNSVIEEAKHVGAIFAARPCVGRGNGGCDAKQNPGRKGVVAWTWERLQGLLPARSKRWWILPVRRALMLCVRGGVEM